MDGQLTLSLKEYTDLVIENNNLKRIITKYNRKIERDIEEKIYDSKINALDINELKTCLSKSDKELLSNFTANYSWAWRSIADDNYSIKTEDEIKEMAASLIKKMMNDRLNDLLEKDEENENE